MIKRKDFLAIDGEEICRLSNAGHRLIYWEHTSGGYDFYFSTAVASAFPAVPTDGEAPATVETVLTSPHRACRCARRPGGNVARRGLCTTIHLHDLKQLTRYGKDYSYTAQAGDATLRRGMARSKYRLHRQNQGRHCETDTER